MYIQIEGRPSIPNLNGFCRIHLHIQDRRYMHMYMHMYSISIRISVVTIKQGQKILYQVFAHVLI